MPEEPQTTPATTVEELLVHAGWLRDLALRLAGDRATAEDAVQETWIAAMRRPPRERETARPWLAKVLRNALRMRARGEDRRATRERTSETDREIDSAAPSPEALLSRAETQRRLANLVLELDEPYRTTVLLHFGEGMSLAEIARSQDIAPSTARWRLKTALDQLRDALDAGSGGRERWALAFVSIPNGAFVAKKTSVTIVVLILLFVAGGLLWMWKRGPHMPDDERAASRADAITSTTHRLDRRAAGDDALPAWLVQPGVEPRRIAGQVLFEGRPVAGAAVELASLASDAGLAAAPRATTGADGRFDFGERSATTWVVRASATGKAGAAVEVDLRNPTAAPPPDQLRLLLGPCDTALVGTVFDASGGVVAGARLSRQMTGARVGRRAGAGVETGADGAFELCVEPSWPRWMSIDVAAEGYGAIVYSGSVVGRLRVDFELVPEATIAGRVVADQTGEPVAGAYVSIPQGMWGVETTAGRAAFAGADGRFRITGLAPGRHRVAARADSMVGGRAAEREVTVGAGDIATVELRLGAGARVSGVVRAAGEPVAGALIFATAPDGTASDHAVSQGDGSFALTEVPRGVVRFHAPPFDVVAPQSAIIDRAEHAGVVVEVESRGAITGVVTRGQRRVARARIDVQGPNARDLPLVFTDARGHFELRGLRPGPWILFASHPREGAFGRVPEIVKLSRGETRDVAIELAYGASVSGVVLDQNGAAVAGVPVQLVHSAADDTGLAMTDADGAFRATTMSGGGTYRVHVLPYPGATSSLSPAPGTEMPVIALEDGSSEVTGVVLRVQLDRLTIAGVVVDSGGAAIADARVVAKAGPRPQFLRWRREAGATSDAAGRFAITNLAAGTYALQARSPAGPIATAEAIEAPRRDVVLVLPSPGSIEGTLAGFQSPPEVTAVPIANGGTSIPGDVSGPGFVVRDLSPGRYVVLARNEAEAATATVDVGPAAVARVALTSGGSSSVRGRVVEHRSKQPVEGMTCQVVARSGDRLDGSVGPAPVRTDAGGRFAIDPAPAGDVAVVCHGLWTIVSDGVRLLMLRRGEPPTATIEVEVPVVAWSAELAQPLASFGAELDRQRLTPILATVSPDGPAASAGLRSGDVIVAVDGDDVTSLSPTGVTVLIANRAPGSAVSLAVRRGSQTITADIVLVDNESR